jgi:hypothetical protein
MDAEAEATEIRATARPAIVDLTNWEVFIVLVVVVVLVVMPIFPA